MLELLLLLCVVLPIAWLLSEFQSHRLVSVVLGISAISVVGLVAYGWAAVTITFDKNLYFGNSNVKLINALSDELERGNVVQVRRELRRFAKSYHSSYENYPPYDKEVDLLVTQLGEASSADSDSATARKSTFADDQDAVTVSGIYNLAGKFGPYIRLGETGVYLVANQSASWPDFDAKRVIVTGSLRLEPAGVSTSDAVAVPPARLLLTTTPDSIALDGSHQPTHWSDDAGVIVAF